MNATSPLSTKILAVLRTSRENINVTKQSVSDAWALRLCALASYPTTTIKLTISKRPKALTQPSRTPTCDYCRWKRDCHSWPSSSSLSRARAPSSRQASSCCRRSRSRSCCCRCAPEPCARGANGCSVVTGHVRWTTRS